MPLEADFVLRPTRRNPEEFATNVPTVLAASLVTIASRQCLSLRGRRPGCSVGSLIPSLSIQANDEQPQAKRSLPQKRRQLDPGHEIARQARCKQVRETVDQVRQTGDCQQYADH